MDTKLKLALYGWRNFTFQTLIALSIIFIASALGILKFTSVYLLIIISSRFFIKGYHVKSRALCFFLSVFLHISIILLGKYLLNTDINYLYAFPIAITLIFIEQKYLRLE